MWWKADPTSLTRMADRITTVYVEHATIGRDSNAVVFHEATGDTHLPAATVACLLLGPGTRTTHAAMRLLADSGTSVCWVGENGVRMYAHGVSTAQSGRYVLRQAWLVSDQRRRLGVARRMYEMRFPGEDVAKLTMQQLRGREGARVKNTYRAHSQRTGVAWSGRRYLHGQAHAAGDDVNRLLSALNTCLYGACHAAVVGVGASAALGFVHTGSALSFVLDVADLYKAETTIPAAFDLAAEGAVSERAARLRFRDTVVEHDLMPRVVADVRHLLFGYDDAPDPPAGGVDQLVDVDGAVAGGFNWSTWDEP